MNTSPPSVTLLQGQSLFLLQCLPGPCRICNCSHGGILFQSLLRPLSQLPLLSEQKPESSPQLLRLSVTCPLHTLISPTVSLLTLSQSHWPPCWSSNTPETFLPQGLCTCCCSLCLEVFPPDTHIASSLPTLISLLKCYFFHDAYSDPLVSKYSLTPPLSSFFS